MKTISQFILICLAFTTAWGQNRNGTGAFHAPRGGNTQVQSPIAANTGRPSGNIHPSHTRPQPSNFNTPTQPPRNNVGVSQSPQNTGRPTQVGPRPGNGGSNHPGSISGGQGNGNHGTGRPTQVGPRPGNGGGNQPGSISGGQGNGNHGTGRPTQVGPRPGNGGGNQPGSISGGQGNGNQGTSRPVQPGPRPSNQEGVGNAHYGHGGYTIGNGCYDGPIHTSGGVGINHYFNGGCTTGGTGIIPVNYVTNYYCNNTIWFSNNWNTACNSYYGYGYHDWYGFFGIGGYSGYCYNGWYGNLSFSLVYPFLDPGCQLVTFVPQNDRRTVILSSACGTFWWRVIERRTWIPGCYTWVDGFYQWVPGYWSWRVVRKHRIYDYWDCPDCYYYE